MADMVTPQKLRDADIDVENLSKAVNEKGMVNPRYGDPYLTLPSAIQRVIETGGFEPFATEAELKSTTPTLPKKASYALDTHKIWLWDEGAWIDTGLSTLDQAKNYLENKLGHGESDVLLVVNDVNGKPVVLLDKLGYLHLPYLNGAIQNEIINILNNLSSINAIASQDQLESGLFKLCDRNSKAITFIDKLGYLYLPHLNDSLQNEISQLKNQVISLSQLISNSNNSEAADEVDSIIGGVSLEADGAIGSIYEGFKLSAGDDFNFLDILAPHRPLGRWFTTRTYLPGARGSDAALNRQYNTDPFHTGYNDSNRGVPVGFDNMFVEGSILTLNARRATTEEAAHFQGDGRNELASMISSIGAFSMYPGDEGDGENILEWRVRYIAEDDLGYAAGWHPTLWTQSSLPSITYNSNEWDVLEGNQHRAYVNYNEWGQDGSRTGGSTLANTTVLHDGQWHTVAAKFSHSHLSIYIDGNLFRTFDVDTNSFNEPAYSLITNHVYNGVFGGNAYDEADWALKPAGMTMQIDWTRLWRKNDKDHIKPLQRVIPVDITHGSSGLIALPSKLNLWGRVDVEEHIQCVAAEENEPGGSHTKAYNSLPDFIKYDKTNRTISINTKGQKSGRINFIIYGYLHNGSTCEPARTYANVGPSIKVEEINLAINDSFDLYAVCDCGVLVTNGVSRAKLIEVNNLPVGVSYNDLNGFLISQSASSGVSFIVVTCENSVGQLVSKRIKLKVGG